MSKPTWSNAVRAFRHVGFLLSVVVAGRVGGIVMGKPEENSIFRTEGLTEMERDELIRARAWFNLNRPPTVTPGEARDLNLNEQQRALRNGLLRNRWLEHRADLRMSPTPPYQASDGAIVSVVFLPDGTRVRIQSRNDPGPDVRRILGSQTTLRQLENGLVVSTTSTMWTPAGTGSGVTGGNMVHIEPWIAAIMNRLGVQNATALLELPMCQMCDSGQTNPSLTLPDGSTLMLDETGVPNFARMLPANSRVTLVNPEYAETVFSVHGPRGPGYGLRRIDYEVRFSPPAAPRMSTEAVRQAMFRARQRPRSGGFIDLGALFSIGKTPTSALNPGRLASMRKAMPTVGMVGLHLGTSLVTAWVLASVNERTMRKEFEKGRPAINQEVVRQTDQIMTLLASGQRAFANVEMIEQYEDCLLVGGPGPPGTMPNASSFTYAGTTISSQPRDGDPVTLEPGFGIAVTIVRKRHSFSIELKVPPDVMAAYQELQEGIKWLDVAVEDPFLERDEVFFLSQRKQELEMLSRELFDPPANLPTWPPQPADGVTPQSSSSAPPQSSSSAPPRSSSSAPPPPPNKPVPKAAPPKPAPPPGRASRLYTSDEIPPH